MASFAHSAENQKSYFRGDEQFSFFTHFSQLWFNYGAA